MTNQNQPLSELLAFIVELGRALLAAGEPINSVGKTLRRVAKAYQVAQIRLIVLPTVLLVELANGGSTDLSIRATLNVNLRFNQIDALFKLVHQAESAAVTPHEGRLRLREIWVMPPRFSPLLTLVGHTILVVGLALIIQPTQLSLGVAAVTGTLIGVLKLFSRRPSSYDILLPVLSAFLVTLLVYYLIDFAPYATPLRLLIPPLATFLPGALLTVATVDLASREIVSGASRLVAGAIQVALLAFGIGAAYELLGISGAQATANVQLNQIGWWAPLLGVAVFGVGNYFHLSAPQRSLPWLLVALYVAWAGQQLGIALLGSTLGGFVGALTILPLASLLQRLGGPPARVMSLPALWLLVPGALALISATQLVNQEQLGGLDDLMAALTSILSIALGLLVGVAVLQAYENIRESHVERDAAVEYPLEAP